MIFIIVGASNAVNLTDGLDGLAIGPVMTASATYLLFAYLTGNVKIANYLQILYVSGVGELSIFCGAMVGASLGFLWFNTYPAQVFMGDVGSLALGGAWNCRGDNKTGDTPCHCRRDIRHGGPVSHIPGRFLQAQG